MPKQLLQSTEEQLRQAQRMEAIGRLAGGLAHDFNNILSVILGYGEMALAKLRPGDPLYLEISQITMAGERAANLTRQLLLFSRQQALTPQVIDLNHLLISMETMLRRLVGEDVDLVFVQTRPLGRVRSDPGSLEQVVMNLIINARDAMPAGGTLTVETAGADLDEAYAANHPGITPGAHTMLAVKDTGIGMDKETQSRIFEPFFTTKAECYGTGLGLSTVFTIVEQNRGSVWVESEVGKGTTFRIYLPCVDAPIEADTRAVSLETLRGSETILLVEDEDSVRSMAVQILKEQGYTVMDSCGGDDALLMCEQYSGAIHLLLTDVVMPRMCGPELARRLQQRFPDLKVLFMSGYTSESIVRHGVLEENVAFLQKPITRAALLKKIRAVLDASGGC